MSWQAEVFDQLRTREWHQLGSLFEHVEAQIPLHTAMRCAMQKGGLEELPTPSQARWIIFLHVMAMVGVETSGNPRKRKWTDEVRLRYLADRSCAECGGPVIRKSWIARKAVACLACQPPAPTVVVPQPIVFPVLHYHEVIEAQLVEPKAQEASAEQGRADQQVVQQSVPAPKHAPPPRRVAHRAKMEAKHKRRRPAPVRPDKLSAFLRLLHWLKADGPIRGPPGRGVAPAR